MIRSIRFVPATVVALSIFSPPAFTDTLIMMDHSGHMGPKHGAFMQCVDAARHVPALGDGLTFSKRKGMSTLTADGTRTVVLSGTTWEAGARVPVTIRCDIGPRQRVASVVRIENTEAIADAAR